MINRNTRTSNQRLCYPLFGLSNEGKDILKGSIAPEKKRTAASFA
jgi:hypothetical protein